MRLASSLGGLAVVLALAGPLAAEPPADVRVVTVPDVKVWCGPSTGTGLYPTNLLHQGDRVEVLEEFQDSGWLKIRPPRGSFSWINTRFLKPVVPQQTNYVVTQEDAPAPVFVGSAFLPDRRPTIIGSRLPRGAQVRGLGPTKADGEGSWLPIEPPPAEGRYIRAEAVARTPPGSAHTVAAAGSFAVNPPTGGAAGAAAPASPSPGPPPAPNGHTLWLQAQQAERSGRLNEAIRLYELAGQANLSVNPERANLAFSRANWLRQAANTSAPPSGSYYYPDRPVSPPNPSDGFRPSTAPSEGRFYTLPNDTSRPAPTQLIAPAGLGCVPGQLCSTPNVAAGGWGGQPQGNPSWPSSGPGRLRRAGRVLERQATYVLDDYRGLPILYAAGSNVDLAPYVNRNVELIGPIVYRGDLRANFMTVMSVRLLP